jgi:hypothetical protein
MWAIFRARERFRSLKLRGSSWVGDNMLGFWGEGRHWRSGSFTKIAECIDITLALKLRLC